MQITNLIYEGKSKKLFATDNPDYAVISFKDEANAFNGLKRGSIMDKGIFNAEITKYLYTFLESKGIKTHFIRTLDKHQVLIKNVEIIPIVIKLRNIVAGSLVTRIGWSTGTKLNNPIIELCYKDVELNTPMINESHIKAMNLASDDEVEFIKTTALKINQLLRDFLKTKNIELVDFKIEFGRYNNDIILADEITPDNSRMWDSETHEPLDMDRFRSNLGDVSEAYKEIVDRLAE